MSELTILVQKNCRYCQEALSLIDEITAHNPKLRGVSLRLIDECEHPEVAKNYSYWYVPTFYRGTEKLFEGAVDRETMELILGSVQ